MPRDLELSSLEGKGAAPCAVGIPDLYSLTSMFMVLAHFWQLRPSFPLEFAWSWRESVDTTRTDVAYAKCLRNIVRLSFHVHYRVENLQHCFQAQYYVLIFPLFNVQEDEVVYLSLLLDVINLIERVLFEYLKWKLLDGIGQVEQQPKVNNLVFTNVREIQIRTARFSMKTIFANS